MKRILICFLFISIISFSNNNSEIVEFKEISFDEYKIENNFQLELNSIFKKPDKKSFFYGSGLSELINKFSNINYLSLKIKRSKERENELKISFSKSSLAIKYMLD